MSNHTIEEMIKNTDFDSLFSDGNMDEIISVFKELFVLKQKEHDYPTDLWINRHLYALKIVLSNLIYQRDFLNQKITINKIKENLKHINLIRNIIKSRNYNSKKDGLDFLLCIPGFEFGKVLRYKSIEQINWMTLAIEEMLKEIENIKG